ncbi:DUF6308 family protein [Streptomyces pseudovenezuelae]|uniref:DUF6308 family protein n=1 Tax=Streptomyces pseudovenezuelae TaxID=67350 RepID=UPI0036E7522C
MPFTGSRFEHLAGGGDRQAVANVVTADDLIAVQTLPVRIPVQVAVELLEGDLGVRLSELLSSVRFDIDMVEAEAADLAEGSPAHTAWRALCDQPGIGWVTAGGLLARKRPRLLPVYDQVVRCVLGRPKSFWPDLHGALRADNHALHRELMGPTAVRRPPRDRQRVAGLRRGALDVSPVRIINREAASGPEVRRSHRREPSAPGHMALCPR